MCGEEEGTRTDRWSATLSQSDYKNLLHHCLVCGHMHTHSHTKGLCVFSSQMSIEASHSRPEETTHRQVNMSDKVYAVGSLSKINTFQGKACKCTKMSGNYRRQHAIKHYISFTEKPRAKAEISLICFALHSTSIREQNPLRSMKTNMTKNIFIPTSICKIYSCLF